MPQILRINMSDMTTKYEEFPEKYKKLGGRALTSTLVFDEVPPTCEPLGGNCSRNRYRNKCTQFRSVKCWGKIAVDWRNKGS